MPQQAADVALEHGHSADAVVGHLAHGNEAVNVLK
jgi:hypothetical protein